MTTRAILSFVLLLTISKVGQAQWTSAHANARNSGFVKVDTIPAANPLGYANVGPVADGANPVIATDGVVYIGNTAGELIALRPDGTPFWKRQLYPFQGGIYAPPVIGADGSIYVVSQAIVADSNSAPHSYSYLHKFSPGGAWLYWVSFPLQNPALPEWVNGGATSAPPNIWRFNGTEVIIVPVWYQVFSNWELRLVAFSTTLGVLGVQPVTTRLSGDVTGSSGFFCDPFPIPCIRYNEPIIPSFIDAGWPTPGAAIWENSAGSPWIWVADGVRSTVAYKFDLTTGFFEVFRLSDDHDRRSSPPLALDVATVAAVVGTSDGHLKFERSNIVISGFDSITAAPTQLSDGRLVVIDRSGLMSVLNGARITLQTRLNGESIASAAASCTHLFVASRNEFVTYDLKTLLPVVRVPWTEGGRYAPVIGPSGRVYGMTKFGLFVFPPPAPRIGGGLLGPACDQPVLNIGGGLLGGAISLN
jgi:hypothetical protein